VDTKQLFEQYAPHGIVDRELIMEHVHPTLLGYAIMSEAFYRAIQQQQVIKDKPETELSFVQLRHEMPITKLDSAMGQYQIMMLKTQWPFNQPIDKNFKVGSSVDENMAVKVALGHMLWATALGQVFAYDKKTGDIPGQLKIAEAMVLQYPQTPDFYGYSGNLNAKLGNYAQAAFYYRKLYMLNNDATLPQIIFKLYLEADDPANALKYVANSASPKALTAVLNEIINDESQLKTNPGNKTLTQQIAADYNKLGLDKVKLNNGK
jgi:hypothetical protein